MTDDRPFTPDTEAVRSYYDIAAGEVEGHLDRAQNEAEFDRWLAAHDAEVRAQALRDASSELSESIEWEYALQYTDMGGSPADPRIITDKEMRDHSPDGHRADGSPYWNHVVLRRRKAGAWERVPDENERAADAEADVWQYGKDGDPWGAFTPINAEDVAYWQGRGYKVYRSRGTHQWELVPVETDDEGE